MVRKAKIKFILFFWVALLLPVPGGADPDPDAWIPPPWLTPSERRYLAGRGRITYCVHRDRMPFEDIREGAPDGLAPDLIGMVEARLGITFRPVPSGSWASSREHLRDGRCEILAAVDVTVPEDPALIRTAPYLRYTLAVAMRGEAPFISGIPDLVGRTVGINGDRPKMDTLVARFPAVAFAGVEDIPEGLAKVSTGDLDAFVAPLPLVDRALRRATPGSLKIAGYVDLPGALGIGVRKDLPDLRTILDKAIASFTEAEIDTLHRRWLAAPPEDRFDPAWLWAVAAAALIAGLAVFLWRRETGRLRRRIADVQAELQTKQKEVETLMITDPLTCLNNRPKLKEVLGKEAKRFERYGRTSAVILMDVDRFKAVNDTYGHNLGDVVLCKIGELLRNNVRKADTSGRWGGEEFMVLCPETDTGGAARLAENLRRTIEGTRLPKVGTLTCSFGVAVFRGEDTGETVVGRAEEALARAKAAGRNRVEVGKGSAAAG